MGHGRNADTHPRSRGLICPSYASFLALEFKGRREGRALAAPVARQQQKKLAAVTTGSAENTRPSLRDGFNAYIVLSPGTGLSCPCHERIVPLT
jgi:hypothetical protein